MNIVSIQIGYGSEIKNKISLNIYLAGCHNNKLCDRKKCHNPELHSFKVGSPWQDWFNTINNIIDSKLIDCIVLLGGEPFDQNLIHLNSFLIWFKKEYPIYIYTGYTKEQLFKLKKEYLDNVCYNNICYGEFIEGEDNKKWFK